MTEEHWSIHADKGGDLGAAAGGDNPRSGRSGWDFVIQSSVGVDLPSVLGLTMTSIIRPYMASVFKPIAITTSLIGPFVAKSLVGAVALSTLSFERESYMFDSFHSSYHKRVGVKSINEDPLPRNESLPEISDFFFFFFYCSVFFLATRGISQSVFTWLIYVR